MFGDWKGREEEAKEKFEVNVISKYSVVGLCCGANKKEYKRQGVNWVILRGGHRYIYNRKDAIIPTWP